MKIFNKLHIVYSTLVKIREWSLSKNAIFSRNFNTQLRKPITYFIFMLVALFIMSFGFVVTRTYAINENLTDNPADDAKDYYENQEIVVARYNEKLDWVEQEPFIRHPIVVYNKMDNDNFVKSHNIKREINLSNVGR